MKHLAAHVLTSGLRPAYAAILMCGLCAALSAAAADPSRTANQAWVLSQIAASQRADGRYPLFLLNLNPGEARVWNGVELKATTNNFDSSLVFFAASATNGDNPSVFNRDWCRLFVLTRRADSDIRRWVRIKNTAALDGYAPLVLAVLVDPDLLRRGQGTAWLRESNANLVWSYTRIGLASSETDQDGRACWRPAMPAKWYATLPEWANQPESAVDATDIVDYVAPWTEEIAAAISAIGGVTPEMVSNIVNAATSDIPRITESMSNPGWAADSDRATVADFANQTSVLVGGPEGMRYGDDIINQLDEATADVSTLGAQVSSIGSYLNAEDARLVSTNYDSETRIPEAYVEVRLNDHGTNKWVEIWREMRRWNAFTGLDFDWNAWNGFQAFQTNVITELAYKADRAWGAYDSETGGYSPEGYTQISSPNILIASGMAYQRTVTSDGAVWVLQCNNGVAQIGGDTNGYFRIMDADGNTQFEIIKGDRREMGADASGITLSNGNVMTIPYSVEAAEHPVIQCTATLDAPSWKDETDANCPCTVSWSGTSGAWVATVTPKSASPSMFVKATYMAGGETYIRNVAPVGMDSIILNGTKYYLGTATISGHTVLTLSTTAP